MWNAFAIVTAVFVMSVFWTFSPALAISIEEFYGPYRQWSYEEHAGENDPGLLKSIEKYSAEIKSAGAMGDVSAEARLLVEMSDTQKRLGQHAEAVKSLEKAAVIYREIKDQASETTTLKAIADIYANVGPLERALDFLEKSLLIQKKSGEEAVQIATLTQLARVYELLGQYQRSLDFYQTGYDLAKKINDQRTSASLMNAMGRCRMAMGDPDEALKLLEKAFKIQANIDDRLGSSRTVRNLVSVRMSWGQYTSAIELCDREIAKRKTGADTAGLHHLLVARSLVFKELGDYDEALASANRALELCRSGKPSFEFIEIMSVIAELNMLQGSTDLALAACDSGLNATRRIYDRTTESNVLILKGRVLSSAGLFAEALKVLDDAAKIKKDMGAPLYSIIEVRAEIALESGHDLESAENSLRTFPARYESGRGALLGRIALKRGNFQKALKEFGAESGAMQVRFACGVGVGLSLEALKQPEKAQQKFQEIIKAQEQVRDSLGPNLRKHFFRVSLFGFSRTVPYEALCRILVNQKKYDEALRIAEMTKARSFSDIITTAVSAGDSGLPENVLADDREINYKFETLSGIMLEKSGSYVSNPGHEGSLERLREHRYRHISKLRKIYPGYAALRYPEPMSLNELSLNPDEWAVEYEVTDTGIVSFLLKGREIKKAFFSPIERKVIEKLILSFRRPLEIDDSSQIMAQLRSFNLTLGRKLADLLIGPVLSHLPHGVTVIISPDEFLGLIPFEMLVLNDSGKIITDESGIPVTKGVQFFGDRNALVYTQSLTSLTLVRLQSSRKSGATRVMAMIDPVFSVEDPHFDRSAIDRSNNVADGYSEWTRNLLMSVQDRMTFPRLEQTRSLGPFIRELHPGQSDIYEGMQASKRRLFESDLTKYKTLAFATHGYAGCDLPGIREPVLALTLVNQPEGEDGFLRMSEVAHLKMNAEIVTLTGCKTGIGRYVAGEGAMYMGRAFQVAGASNALISLWNVAEDPSVELTRSFFAHIRDGKTKLQALQAARRDVRVKFDHPFFWAAFILVGGGD